MGGATSIDITREGVDKAYGLKKLRDASGIALDAMMFIGDAIFPGGNDYPAKELGLDTVRVRDTQETLSVIDAIVACQKHKLASKLVRMIDLNPSFSHTGIRGWEFVC